MNLDKLSKNDILRRTRLIYSIYSGNNFKRTRGEIAQSAGYTPEYLSRIISGNRRLTNEAAKHFSIALNVREEYLLGEDEYMTEEDLAKEFDTQNKISNSIFSISYIHDNILFSKLLSKFATELIDFNQMEKQKSEKTKFLIESEKKNIILNLHNNKYIELSDKEYFSLCDEISQYIQFKIEYLFKTKKNNYIPQD